MRADSRTAGSLQRNVRRLRRALREIRDQLEPHLGEDGEDVRQDTECFCPRCIAVRALSPNAELSDSRPL